MSEWKEAILALFEQYMGEITIEDETISIQARNFITDHWGKLHKIMCKVEATIRFGGISVSAEEATLSIIGGSSCGQNSLEEALKIAENKLKRYNFVKKESEQTSLF